VKRETRGKLKNIYTTGISGRNSIEMSGEEVLDD
jgi:hypothetical protein